MKQTKVYLVALLAIFTLVVSCKEGEKDKPVITTAPIEFKKDGTLEIVQQQTDSVLVKLDIEIAESEYAKLLRVLCIGALWRQNKLCYSYLMI